MTTAIRMTTANKKSLEWFAAKRATCPMSLSPAVDAVMRVSLIASAWADDYFGVDSDWASDRALQIAKGVVRRALAGAAR